MVMSLSFIRNSLTIQNLVRNFRYYSTLQRNGNFQAWTKTPLMAVNRFKSTRERVNITFAFADGSTKTVKARVGDTLLDVVIDENVDIDGFGACEGTLSCSTCHLIFEKKDYDNLPNKPGEEEMDMLDLAYELTDTSRLGCQIEVTKDHDGLVVNVPVSVLDARDV